MHALAAAEGRDYPARVLLFPLLLAVGFGGLIAMAMLGFAHAPALHKHAGPKAGAVHPAAGARVLAAKAAAAPAKAAEAAPMNRVQRVSGLNKGLTWLAPLISPLHWFSWMFGAGAAGTLAGLTGAGRGVTVTAAVAGALTFHLAVVRPIWNLIFRFESTPAGNLEACLLQEVEAVTSFNARGDGLVRVTIDGRSEDVLARLSAAERARDSRPQRGDRLVIEEVDSATNTCIVSRP